MKYEKFKSRAMYKIYYNKYSQDVWGTIKQVKNETSNIDFGCKFDSKGYCNSEVTFYGNKMDQMCCCKNCSITIGYLDVINSNEDLKYYAKLFNDKTGFWRKGKGCILDRSMRSITCIVYTCKDMLKPKMNKIGNKIKKLHQQTINV